MKSFLAGRTPRFTGLTGTKKETDAAREAFRAFAQRNHNLRSPDGHLVDHFHDGLTVAEVTSRLHVIIHQTPQEDQSLLCSPGKDISKPAVEKESLSLLDKKQVASIRHIGNLARQLKGDWSNMMGPTNLKDGFGAYRFQLACSFYALVLAHFHRLPAAPGLFQNTLERIIEKMCHPDVWFYWRDAGTGGGVARTPRAEPNANPIEKDNIMYSAYLQTMTLMYNSLFDDDRFTKPGALKLQYDPFFWGDNGGFSFEYDQDSLNERIYWNMVQGGYLGVACEPWCVFQICN
ncbi:hypothetical protein ACHAPI_010257 [Fusarium lateritium]